MQNRKKKRQTFKIKALKLIILVVIAITIIAIITIKDKKEKTNVEPVVNTDVNLLKGTFAYSENVKYEFNENNKGVLHDKDNSYKFSYTISNQQVTLNFEDETIHEATYTFYFVDNDLKLIGGKGTIGGEYILKREN